MVKLMKVNNTYADGTQWVDLSADLSNYYTKAEVNALISNLLTIGGE